VFKVGDEVEYCEGILSRREQDRAIYKGVIESETKTLWRVRTQYGSVTRFRKPDGREFGRIGILRYIRKAVTK